MNMKESKELRNNCMLNIKVTPTALEHIDDIMEVEKLSFKIPWSREAFFDEIA